MTTPARRRPAADHAWHLQYAPYSKHVCPCRSGHPAARPLPVSQGQV